MSTSEAVLISAFQGGENLGTFIQRVVDEVARASDKDIEAIKRAMITSMRHFQPLRLWWKEETATFDLVADQQSYSEQTVGTDGWPSDFVSPKNLYIKVGGTRWLPLAQVDMDDMRFLTPTEDTIVGVPSTWAWYDDKIWLSPIPTNSSSDWEIRMDYIAEPGIPAYYFDGTEWAFFGPTGAALTNNWTSPWFTNGEALLRARTKWDLYYHYYDDAENAMKMGGMDGEGGAVQNALDGLRRRHNAKKYTVRRSTTLI